MEEEAGKIFVGGLSWDTKEDGLKAYFQGKFGEVSTCVIMRDTATQRSRGFGFVTFTDPSQVQKVLNGGPHNLDGRTIDPKAAVPRGSQPPPVPGRGPPNGLGRGRQDPRPWPPVAPMMPPQHQHRPPYTGPTKKIFIGGLNPNTTDDDVKSFFAQHGNVVEVVLKYDQSNNRMRGFGFVSFDSEATVEKLVEKHFVTISSKNVEIKKAEPRNQPGHAQGQFQPRTSQYWPDTQGYSAYAYARGPYGPPPPSQTPYYPTAYSASPAAPYNPSYPAYSSGAYGSQYGSGPTYGSAGYTGASYGTAAYASTGGNTYESYSGTSAQGSHRAGQYEGAPPYAAAGSASNAPYGDSHSPVAPSAYPATGGGSNSSYGGGVAVTTTASDAHAHGGYQYSGDYRSAPAPGPSYVQQSGVAAGSMQPSQRSYSGY